MNTANNTHWDFIIVGARCAGATLATLMARKGFKTLMLDSTAKGSNKAMSTHAIRPPGIEVLKRLGLGDRLTSNLTPSNRLRLALNDAEIISDVSPEYSAYTIRRHVIDRWLQELAEDSGAYFLDNQRVINVIRAGERVAGVVTKSESGYTEYRGKWVIGADGAHSTIAKLVDAKEYLASDETERAGYWAYFRQPETWPYPWDSSLEYLGDDFFFTFRCDDNLMLLAYGSDRDAVKKWGKEKKEKLLQALKKSPSTSPLVKDNEPTSRIYGVADSHFYYRKPYGPGYALVGDAGHYIHYSTGWGMSNAFCDAEKLSAALADGRMEALHYFWRERDASTIATHFEAHNQAKLANNNVFTRDIFYRINRSPMLLKRVKLMIQGQIPVDKMIPQSVILGAVKTAVQQGQFELVREFLKFAPTQIKQDFIIKQFRKKRDKSLRSLMKLTPKPLLMQAAEPAG